MFGTSSAQDAPPLAFGEKSLPGHITPHIAIWTAKPKQNVAYTKPG